MSLITQTSYSCELKPCTVTGFIESKEGSLKFRINRFGYNPNVLLKESQNVSFDWTDNLNNKLKRTLKERYLNIHTINPLI